MERVKIKRRRESEEKERLTQVYEEFKDDFDGSRVKINTMFVRGEVVNAGQTDFAPAPVVKPQIDPSKAKELASKIGQRIIMEAKQKKVASQIQFGGGVTPGGDDGAPINRPPKPGTKKETSTRKSNLEAFKEELKQIQEMRQERREQLKQKFGDSPAVERLVQDPFLLGHSEFDTNPDTTNLYLASLDPDITLEDLYDTFGSFGPLASAKILYPKPEEARKCPLLSGFVAFMARADAERAMAVMPGEQIKASKIRASWAKPVNLPAVPFYIPKSLRNFAMPDPPSGLPFNAKPNKYDMKKFLKKHEKLPRISELQDLDQETKKDYCKILRNAVVRVVIPTERPLLFLIHRTIEFLIREGPMFEALIMKKERNNPVFRFLFDNNHPTHVYYRWRLYSVLNGEDRSDWSIRRFKMFEGGSWWEPPPHSLFSAGMPPQLYHKAYKSTKREEKRRRKTPESPDRKRQRKVSEPVEVSEPEKVRGVLSEKEWDELQDMLRDLKPERQMIGDAMIWCVDHADCAKEISECLYQSLGIPETPLHKKIARLYLIADILANCGIRVRDVFKYRHCFEQYLSKIFLSLNETLESIESRLKAEQFRQRVMLCFRHWEDNSIYTRDLLINLQNVFLGLVKPDTKKHESEDEEDVDGVPLDFSATAPSKNNEEGSDSDIDGVPLQSEPINKDNPDESKVWNQNTLDEFASKWDAIEPELTEEENREGKGFFKPLEEVAPSPQMETNVSKNGGIHAKSTAWEEERRRLLRDIEMKVVEYQDELESDLAPNVEQKLEDYRKKLIDKMEKELESFEEGELVGSQNDKKEKKKRSRDKKGESQSRRRSRSRSRSDSRGRSRRSRSRSPLKSRSRSTSRERRRDSRRHRESPDRRRRNRSPDRDRRRR
ncbi:unnamed protein product [Bursaphelenchus xylophilus]|uniref:(pine wood nematode) hypothetical protein n=1 Tax=Bursaphelenchus xylophilus TaxID=6326 RepID=A0A1I7SM91_BURXY|nr:unnamed protein product [Bursaphelenchus xylophilus]CAG9130050.1 unnamed protein product [Bursaphelenchus xylophilus]